MAMWDGRFKKSIDKKTNEYEYEVINKNCLAFDHDEIVNVNFVGYKNDEYEIFCYSNSSSKKVSDTFKINNISLVFDQDSEFHDFKYKNIAEWDEAQCAFVNSYDFSLHNEKPLFVDEKVHTYKYIF